MFSIITFDQKLNIVGNTMIPQQFRSLHHSETFLTRVLLGQV